MSTFAAMTCCSRRLPGAWRESTPRRGSTQCRIARSSPTLSAATQSPTAGHVASPSPSAMTRSFPDGSDQHSPNSPATRHSPRCCDTTRAGTALRSSPNRSFHNASKYPFQPKSFKNTCAPSSRKVRQIGIALARTPCGSATHQRAQTNARRRDRKLNNSMNGKGGRCYLPEGE
jgi:hypothetical protein